MARFFIIGGTGHTGTAVISLVLYKHPNSTVRVLCRSAGKATRLQDKYPRIQPVLGDLSSLDVLESESREADIVIYATPDITHDDAIKASLDGLRDKTRKQKGYFIHTSGAANVEDEPLGLVEARDWDDVRDIEEILSMPESKTHVVTDNLVRSAWPDAYVAIIAPPGIGGISPSADHPVPLTTGSIVRTARAFRQGFEIARGENQSGWVDVMDLARAYMILIDDAVNALKGGRPPAAERNGVQVWGPKAYYYVSSEDISWHDLMTAFMPALKRHGVIDREEVRSCRLEEVVKVSVTGSVDYDPEMEMPPPDSWAVHIAEWFGVNMRIRPSRIKALGWKPVEGSILEAVGDAVKGFLELEAEGRTV